MLEMQVKLMLCNPGRIPMNFFQRKKQEVTQVANSKKQLDPSVCFASLDPPNVIKICPASRFLCSFCPRAFELQLEFEAQIVELFVQVKFWPNIVDSILLTFSGFNHVDSTVS